MSKRDMCEDIALELLRENRRLRAENEALRGKLVAMVLEKHYVDDGERYVKWIYPGAGSLKAVKGGGAE